MVLASLVVGFAAALVCAVFAWVALRKRRIKRLMSEANSRRAAVAIRQRDHGDGASPAPRNGRTTAVIEAGAGAAFAVPATALWELSRIDNSVIRAISAASAHVDGLPAVTSDYSGFLHYVAENGGNFATPGFQHRLLGYVGEQQAADVFASQGHLVEMAASPNNPGWDLLLNGDAVNIKTYQDAANVAAHASANPDITYVVPEDATRIPDLPNVDALSGFFYDGAHGSMQTSFDAAHSLLSGDFLTTAADTGIPFSALGFAVYRQARAVQAGKPVQYAASDLAIDATSRVASTMVGAKAGLALDALAGGHTFGLGTLGGGVAGAIGGAKLSRRIQEGPLRAGQSELRRALADYGEQFRSPTNVAAVNQALAAPAARARRTVKELRQAIDEDSRTLRWWLWPGADQVLRLAALEHGEQAVVAQTEAAEHDQCAWRELVETPETCSLIGLIMANNPHLAASCDLDSKLFERVASALANAERRRVERQHG